MKLSFRPLAGIMVLILDNEDNILQSAASRFRPLAGIMVLILFALVNMCCPPFL